MLYSGNYSLYDSLSGKNSRRANTCNNSIDIKISKDILMDKKLCYNVTGNNHTVTTC